MKTTKLMTGLALVASTLLTTAPVLAQDQTKDSTASLTIEAGERKIDQVPTLNFKVTLSGNITASSLSFDEINPIKLSDYTGSLSGWQLKVKRSDFADTTNSSTTLDGFKLQLTGGSFDKTSDDVKGTTPTDPLVIGTENAEALVATAGKGTGTGATTINYTGATLELPETIKKGKVKVGTTYSSTLTWTLTDAPTN